MRSSPQPIAPRPTTLFSCHTVVHCAHSLCKFCPFYIHNLTWSYLLFNYADNFEIISTSLLLLLLVCLPEHHLKRVINCISLISNCRLCRCIYQCATNNSIFLCAIKIIDYAANEKCLNMFNIVIKLSLFLFAN